MEVERYRIISISAGVHVRSFIDITRVLPNETGLFVHSIIGTILASKHFGFVHGRALTHGAVRSLLTDDLDVGMLSYNFTEVL